MELTRKQVIKNLNALNAVCGQKDFYDKEMKESMRYAISSLETDETYQLMHEGGEIFTKADMVAMLDELKKEIKELWDNRHDVWLDNQYYIGKSDTLEEVDDIIQQKINTLL